VPEAEKAGTKRGKLNGKVCRTCKSNPNLTFDDRNLPSLGYDLHKLIAELLVLRGLLALKVLGKPRKG
jgi:hypothetical protein